jgi:hypothetical protein
MRSKLGSLMPRLDVLASSDRRVVLSNSNLVRFIGGGRVGVTRESSGRDLLLLEG